MDESIPGYGLVTASSKLAVPPMLARFRHMRAET